MAAAALDLVRDLGGLPCSGSGIPWNPEANRPLPDLESFSCAATPSIAEHRGERRGEDRVGGGVSPAWINSVLLLQVQRPLRLAMRQQ